MLLLEYMHYYVYLLIRSLTLAYFPLQLRNQSEPAIRVAVSPIAF